MKALRVVLLSWLAAAAARGAESVCATVKMEVAQELTLERQAFDARMKIHNGFTGLPLTGVSVDVRARDAEGLPVEVSFDPNDPDAAFFIRVDALHGIANVSGTGQVPPAAAAEIRWLLIPAPGAARGRPLGAVYFVGAELRYAVGGEEKVVSVAPDFITVQPMPELDLDYFLPADVLGDDPFTPEAETPVPFPLAVRARNAGTGPAARLKIESAQPKIVDNLHGLLVGFQILSADVGGVPSPLSLLADFGALPAGGAAVARWLMTASLSGQFVDFAARMVHADALGGRLTSLIRTVTAHTLVKDVLDDRPGRDAAPDMLALDGGALWLYDSEGGNAAVADRSAGASSSPMSPQGSETRHAVAVPAAPGLFHVKISDPEGGAKTLVRVVRADGKVLQAANAWLSKTRTGGAWAHALNFFDDGGGAYTAHFASPSAADQPPVFAPVPPFTVAETAPLSFSVSAADPENAPVNLSAAALPVGASFADGGNGTGAFSWTPLPGQAGRYEIVFEASDGALSARARTTLDVVLPGEPPALSTHPAWVAVATPSWTWGAVAGATAYAYRLDGGPEVLTTTRAFTAPALEDGLHTVQVRAVFGGDPVAYGPVATDSFGVDTTPPTVWAVSLDGGAMGTADADVDLDVSHSDGFGSGVARLEYRVDGGSFSVHAGAPVALPAGYGPHTVDVRAVDNVDRVSGLVGSAIVRSYAVHTLTGASASGHTAVLTDLTGVLSASAPVTGGAFQFNGIPAGLFGLKVANEASVRGHPARIFLRESLSVDVGGIEPGAASWPVSGRVLPARAGVPVAAGLELGQGHFFELARTATDAQGNYLLSGLAPALLSLRALPEPSTGYGQTSATVALSSGPVSAPDMTTPPAVPVGGAADVAGARVRSFSPDGRTSSVFVGEGGEYAVALSSAAVHVIAGRTIAHVLPPAVVVVGTSPVIRALDFAPLAFSSAAGIEGASHLVDGATGVVKALQVGAFSPPAVPFFQPRSEEVSPPAAGDVRVHGLAGDEVLALLSDDPARGIHAVNAVPAVPSPAGVFEIVSPGGHVEGTVYRSGGTPLTKPVVLLRGVSGELLGVAEGSVDGRFFFKHVPSGGRYALTVVDPVTRGTAGNGPFSPPEGSSAAVRDVSFGGGNDVRLINYAPAATAGMTTPVTVSWSGVDTAQYNLGLIIGNETGLWAEDVFELPAGAGAEVFPLLIPAGAPAQAGFAYAFLNSKTGGWPARGGESWGSGGLVTVIPGPPPPLAISTYPASVTAGQPLPVTIAWSGIDVSSYNVVLLLGNQAGFHSIGIHEFPAAGGSQSFALPVSPDAPAGENWVYAYSNHKQTGWAGRLADAWGPSPVVVSPPPLRINGYPATVQTGQSAQVSVSWNGVDTSVYNLGLVIANESGIWIDEFFELPGSSGSGGFAVPVPSGTPAGQALVYAFINHKVNGWPERLAEALGADGPIKVTAP